jgi:hypothetical protein
MKYYQFHDTSDDSPKTLSELEILDEYWDYWYGKMCNKYGYQHVDENYTTKHCIEDWVTIHWAQEVQK